MGALALDHKVFVVVALQLRIDRNIKVIRSTTGIPPSLILAR